MPKPYSLWGAWTQMCESSEINMQPSSWHSGVEQLQDTSILESRRCANCDVHADVSLEISNFLLGKILLHLGALFLNFCFRDLRQHRFHIGGVFHLSFLWLL